VGWGCDESYMVCKLFTMREAMKQVTVDLRISQYLMQKICKGLRGDVSFVQLVHCSAYVNTNSMDRGRNCDHEQR
jgi:hypothetical protein